MSISLQVILFALLFIIQKDSGKLNNFVIIPFAIPHKLVYCSFISNSSVCDTDFDELTYDLMRLVSSTPVMVYTLLLLYI